MDIKFLNEVKKYKTFYTYVLNKSHRYRFILRKKNLKNKITKIISRFNNRHITYYDFIPLGYLVGNNFTWINDMNIFFYKHFSKYDLEKCISDDLSRYLFSSDKINLSKKYRYVIPYLIAIATPAFNVIEFRDNNNDIFFGLVKLNIKDNFNYDNFINSLEIS